MRGRARGLGPLKTDIGHRRRKLSRMEKRETKLVFLATIEQAKFRKPVVPGDQLRIEVTFLKLKPSVAKLQCEATVDGMKVAEAGMVCTLVDKPA